MRVLNLSLDKAILDASSIAAKRMRAYATVVEAFAVIVPAKQNLHRVESTLSVYGSGGTLKVWQLACLFFIARTVLKTQTYSVVSSQDAYYLGLIAWVLARTFGCGLEIQAHGIEKDTFVRRRLAQFVYSRASIIRVVSTRLKNTLMNRYGITEDRFCIVPVFVDVGSLALQEYRERSSADGVRTEFRIISVGRLTPVKNTMLQLQVLAEILTTYPRAHLSIVGDGPLRTVLEKEAEKLGLRENVTFHGNLSRGELGRYLLMSDCFLHTAHSEGYAMVLVEAAYAGLPIVTTDVGCVGDVLHNETSALVVPQGSTHAIAQALRQIMNDQELRTTLGSNAQQAAAESASLEALLPRYRAVWKLAESNAVA